MFFEVHIKPTSQKGRSLVGQKYLKIKIRVRQPYYCIVFTKLIGYATLKLKTRKPNMFYLDKRGTARMFKEYLFPISSLCQNVSKAIVPTFLTSRCRQDKLLRSYMRDGGGFRNCS